MIISRDTRGDEMTGDVVERRRKQLPLLGKIGLFGLVGWIAAMVGFAAGVTPSLSELDVQGIGSHGDYGGRKRSTLYIVNMGDNGVENLKYRVSADEKILASGGLSELDYGRHVEVKVPAIQIDGDVEVCLVYKETIYGLLSISRKSTFTLSPSSDDYSPSKSYFPGTRRHSSILSGFGEQTCR